MKKIFLLVSFVVLVAVGCGGGNVSIEKIAGVYPGMSCADFENMLKQQSMPSKKDGKIFQIKISEDAWEEALITCDGNVTTLEFVSAKGTSPKNAQAYIDAQQSLLKAFRGNMITYEEGNKLINLNNGIKLHQFTDSKLGAITHFKISVEFGDDSKVAWASVTPLLPKIGAGK